MARRMEDRGIPVPGATLQGNLNGNTAGVDVYSKSRRSPLAAELGKHRAWRGHGSAAPVHSSAVWQIHALVIRARDRVSDAVKISKGAKCEPGPHNRSAKHYGE